MEFHLGLIFFSLLCLVKNSKNKNLKESLALSKQNDVNTIEEFLFMTLKSMPSIFFKLAITL